MSTAEITWQEKVRRLIGYPDKRGAVPELARLLEEPLRSVRNWIEDDRTPHDVLDLIPRLARKLRVPASWLQDRKEGPPPSIPAAVSGDWIQLVDAIPAGRYISRSAGGTSRDFRPIASVDKYPAWGTLFTWPMGATMEANR